MKSIIFIILLICPAVFADNTELIVGGLTYHMFLDPDITENFSNKVGFQGALIANPIVGLGYTYVDEETKLYDSYRGFIGQNSIGQPMIGGMYFYGKQLKGIDLGMGIGAYIQDDSQFKKRGIDVGSNIIPIYGFEINPKIMLDNKKFIKFNNLISPLLIISTLSFGEEL